MTFWYVKCAQRVERGRRAEMDSTIWSRRRRGLEIGRTGEGERDGEIERPRRGIVIVRIKVEGTGAFIEKKAYLGDRNYLKPETGDVLLAISERRIFFFFFVNCGHRHCNRRIVEIYIFLWELFFLSTIVEITMKSTD